VSLRLESEIAEIWRDTLGVERIGVEDDFFALGGESLTAVRMLAAVEDELLAHVDFVDFLDGPTVAALADAVLAARGEQPSAADTEPLALTAWAPCSFAQERLWFLEQLGASRAHEARRGADRRRDGVDRACTRPSSADAREAAPPRRCGARP